ncbi:transcriptional adapter 2-alpha [Aplysia californica]|uniref:Transcriptional adapter n=1 Tax=Aplysia californica TaxID=6500 RepID=A0ABM1A1U0_APLCA|nr:transcriptional adapter 2-alpha [Aplysia californica]XP_012939102.1 transcriptional adapter 2-alpha [Aplysia californica]
MEEPVSVESEQAERPLATECSSCHTPLEVPWIHCAICRTPTVDLCSRCFSHGAEFGQHECDHPYTVVKLDFPLYESHWTASEELKLLDAIQDCGIGNWQAISGKLRTKTEAECERHYLCCYVEKPQAPLPEFTDQHNYDRGAPVIFKLSDNPPRPAEGSNLWNEMGGYSAARCDFNTEHDNFLELDICHLTSSDMDSPRIESTEEMTEEDQRLYKDLSITVLEVYRNCLLERQRRKKLIREYGLINMRKWFGHMRRRFDSTLSLEILRPFMRLFPTMTFDKYLESLLYEKQLKNQISKLQEYRKNGITVLRAARLYSQLKQRRESSKIQRHLLSDVLNHVKDESSCQSWLARQAVLEGTQKADKLALPNPIRKSAPRLNIEGLQGYEKLNEAEKEMCAEVRLVPQAYLDFSRLLIAECNKHGFLRLAQARTLIKIDVNKTRRLYDFLLVQGLINKDPM